MEPPVAVADFRDNKVTIWASVQNPQATQDTVAAALGINKDDVTVHVTLLGGGFGRKSKPDFAAEAAVLSKKAGKPVKVVWTREDDSEVRLLSFDRRGVSQGGARRERQAVGVARALGISANRVNVRARRAIRARSRERDGAGRSAVRARESPG